MAEDGKHSFIELTGAVAHFNHRNMTMHANVRDRHLPRFIFMPWRMFSHYRGVPPEVPLENTLLNAFKITLQVHNYCLHTGGFWGHGC